MVFVVAIILSLVVLVFGNSLHKMAMEYIPILTYVTGIILRLKGMVSIAILAALFMLLYRFVPNRKVRIIRQAPGAAFSAVCWYVFSIVFSLYVEYSPGLANMYGSLTTIVLVMLWLYFCMYIILIGAEINSCLLYTSIRRRRPDLRWSRPGEQLRHPAPVHRVQRADGGVPD